MKKNNLVDIKKELYKRLERATEGFEYHIESFIDEGPFVGEFEIAFNRLRGRLGDIIEEVLNEKIPRDSENKK